jgi:hypothetical protein
VKTLVTAGVLGLLIVAAPAWAQQRENGPSAADAKDGHVLRGPETGTRGPSGGSPDTGPHGPRDVTKDKEPGKAKPQEELERSGQSEVPKTKTN